MKMCVTNEQLQQKIEADGECVVEAGSPRVSTLREAVEGIDDDYMTSENHHPGYVLIPTAKFEAIRAALSARPVQEPVAWLRVARMTPSTGEEYNSLWLTKEEDERGFPVYRDPPCDPAPSQEPVCTVSVVGAGGHRWLTPHPLNALDAMPVGTPLYAAPQPAHGTSATDSAPAPNAPVDQNCGCDGAWDPDGCEKCTPTAPTPKEESK